MSSSLLIKNLSVQVEDKQILNKISLKIIPGEIHALMGPNGSGKSTFGYSLMGHPAYQITAGTIKLNGKLINDLDANERSHLGLFLSFQHPIAVSGVPTFQFLKLARESWHETQGLPKPKTSEVVQELKQLCNQLNLDEQFLSRPVNDGLSGGERKKLETLQLLFMKPKYVIIDELDTGTDVDTLKLIGQTLSGLTQQPNPPGIVVITHYSRLFHYFQPQYVHILKKGKIVREGDFKLIANIEDNGYDEF